MDITSWKNTDISAYETSSTATASDSFGMMFRTGGLLNTRVKTLADELNTLLSDTTNEMDNPVVLAKISALNGHYNSARQAQSNLMKSVKDTSQAIIRNM
ncbi:EscF/YscF/HrpA family type III secretion system needle major subunit [Yersinia mollaretii]|uniref:EscF/YscF/HrpA family type III secretion system needle major subunit n=1 Tax=Yersinia mollaretii TaxID=33060 RepID=UPI0005E7C6C3|nr:EscF/YscF/HrpA family type III secretion system needle major subunit [Yersinia mollaretii]CNK52104.1 type III secretion apparatus needle protein [Yersinia enterocolitica]